MERLPEFEGDMVINEDEIVEQPQSVDEPVEHILERLGTYIKVTTEQKRNIVVAFARKDKPVYGEAFDYVRLTATVDLDSEENVTENVGSIILIEVKSTGTKKNRRITNEYFDGHFFGLTTAEVLVAQKLEGQYRFIFVNKQTGSTREMSLNDILIKAKSIYPQWSITFKNDGR
jgi:hypothetical protein